LYARSKLIGKSKLDFRDILKPWGKKIERYYHWFSKNEFKNLVEEANFKVEKIGIIKNKKAQLSFLNCALIIVYKLLLH